jgi:hypothetical protein
LLKQIMLQDVAHTDKKLRLLEQPELLEHLCVLEHIYIYIYIYIYIVLEQLCV